MWSKPQEQGQQFSEKKKVYFEQLSKQNEGHQVQAQSPSMFVNPQITSTQNNQWQQNSLNLPSSNDMSYGISHNNTNTNQPNSYNNYGHNNLGGNQYNNPNNYHH